MFPNKFDPIQKKLNEKREIKKYKTKNIHLFQKYLRNLHNGLIDLGYEVNTRQSDINNFSFESGTKHILILNREKKISLKFEFNYRGCLITFKNEDFNVSDTVFGNCKTRFIMFSNANSNKLINKIESQK